MTLGQGELKPTSEVKPRLAVALNLLNATGDLAVAAVIIESFL